MRQLELAEAASFPPRLDELAYRGGGLPSVPHPATLPLLFALSFTCEVIGIAAARCDHEPSDQAGDGRDAARILSVERQTMSTTDIAEAVRKYADAKQAHDLDATIAMCAEDCTYQSIGFGPVVRGKAALREFFGSLFEAVPDYYGEFEGATYNDDTAIVWGRWGGTIAGDFLGLGTVKGNVLDIPVTFRCTFRDGLLVEEVGYFDAATFCAQAGIKVSGVRPGTGSEFARVYEQFWQAPDRNVVPSVITEDIAANWPGPRGIGVGVEHYLRQIDRILSVMPDIKLEVIDHLAEGNTAFLEFRAYGTIDGESVEFFGIDRFKVAEDGRVHDSKVCFDPAVLQRAVWQSDVTSLAPAHTARPNRPGAPR